MRYTVTVPFGFPSHQGLVAPLLRWWPGRFAALPLFVGALVPDVVDGVADITLRGHLGQWMGHSLVGLFLFCLPAGLGLTYLLRRFPRFRDEPPPSLGLDAWSVWVGALSHVFFDLLSHDHSMLLWPWRSDPRWLPDFFYATWFRVTVPGYRDYSIGPHFVAWLLLSVGGAVLFFTLRRRPRRV
jgi:hypothetical protein